MKTHEPKMILNLSVENEELEKKIQIAMDEYIKKISLDKLEDVVSRLIDRKLTLIFSNKYGYGKHINGQTVEQYISDRVNNKIAETIDKNIKAILAERIAKML